MKPKNIETKNKSIMKSRPVTTIFAILAFTGAIFLLNQSNLTGNVVAGDVNNDTLISIIGVCLLVCGIILTIYTIAKR